jgi:chromosome segregation protein
LDAVTVDKSYYPLLALLLANCFLAEDLSTAHQLSLKYPAATFVTRRGEVVAPGGIVSGGAGEDGGEGEIHLRREIRELAERVAFLSGELQQLEEQLTSAKDLLAQGEEEVRSARQRLHESDLAIVNAEKDLQRHRDEERHLAERQEVRTLEDEQLQEERESLLREAEAAVTRQQELLASREGTEKSVSDAEEGLEAIRHELDQAREEVTVAKVRAASLGQKRDENGRLLARTRALIDELLSRQGKSGSDLAAATAERDLLQQQLEGSDDELRRLMRQFSDTEVEFARVKARHDGVAEQLREGELTLRRGRAEHEALRSALAERNITFTSLSLELQHLSATVSDRHRVDISVLTRAHVPPDFDAEAQKRRRQELERLITDLGEVNLLALEQYAELETRHDFLVAQQNDLQESLQGLQQAINRINRTTRRRFQETFALVNERFRQVFPRLFCGGFAELRLTDEDDLLETGIDIIAQPPGKKLQNITALSGGEKALTAVALIFSIFLIKPSPFCLLDEVDAPLDDANIGRFNDMVREMSVTSQFIIITHNKTTMAIADTLYGVTMEEPGVSKLVSVRLAQEQLQKTGEQRAI